MEEVVRRRRFRVNFRGSLSLPFFVFMLFFVVVPLILIVYFSFTDDKGHIYLDNWRLIFTSPDKWKTILLTFEIAILTTVICILIAYPIAYILSNKKFNKNKILVYFFVLPMWVNFVVRTMALRDMANDMFDSIFHFQLTAKYPVAGTVAGMVYDYLPFAILPLYNQMLKMDKNQIEAAADLGANPVVVFFKVILPMTVPGIIAAATMTFMPTMSSYVVADQMGNGKVFIIGSLIENYVNTIHDNNAASILSLVMLFIIGLSLVAEKFFSKKDEDRKVGIW